MGLATIVAIAVWSDREHSCGPFPDWSVSAYVLPYPAGSSYYVSQANCSTGGHRGPYQYAYDFVMPVGTPVTAARAGVVAEIRMKFRDGQSGEGESNWVKIRHADNTIAAYSHLTEHGALVRIGDRVEAGQPIGLSGNSGNTGGLPHFALPSLSLLRAGRLRDAAGDVPQYRPEFRRSGAQTKLTCASLGEAWRQNAGLLTSSTAPEARDEQQAEQY